MKQQLNGTFEEFLKKHDLDVLKYMFYASQTVQGYGRIDQIPTLYGLMWNTPKMMKGLVNRINGIHKNNGMILSTF